MNYEEPKNTNKSYGHFRHSHPIRLGFILYTYVNEGEFIILRETSRGICNARIRNEKI